MKWSHFPGKSSVHRYTCLALYRALLRQCSKLPSTVGENDTKTVVRNQFDKYKTLNSPTKTVHSLEAGYEALDMMHSASQGHTNSIDRLSKILEDIKTREYRKHPSKDIVPTRASPRKKKRAQNMALQHQTVLRHPDAEPILSRPRPVVTGRRRIPALVNANGIPFLRIKKPQPQNLSRVLRQLHEYKEKLTERRHRLNLETLFAKDEEDWDRLLDGRKQTEMFPEPRMPHVPRIPHLSWIEGSWAQSSWKSHNKTVDDNAAFQRKKGDLAEAMWKVVLAERKLAEKEEAERKRSEPSP